MSRNAAFGDLTGKTAVVTGATSGIGLEIARGLAGLGARVVLACRDTAKAEALRLRLASESGNLGLAVAPLDLSIKASVRACAAGLARERGSVDILVNNAGGWSMDRQESADGVERIWATNVLGPELFTRLLLPALMSAGAARVVNLSSTVADGLDLDDVEFKKRPFTGLGAYSASKQANRMLSWALARDVEGSGITVNAMSPGLVRTDLNRNLRGPLKFAFSLLLPLMGKTPAQGADTAIWLAASPDLRGVSGRFWENRKEKPCKFKADTDAQDRLKELCARMAR
jgi:NAD(P)-dependent dehydrogenase (short-subunit alcohol dehydrogenase family)